MCVVEMMEERRKGFRKHCSKCSRIVLGNSVLLPGRAAAVRWQYVVRDDDSAMAVLWQCDGSAGERLKRVLRMRNSHYAVRRHLGVFIFSTVSSIASNYAAARMLRSWPLKWNLARLLRTCSHQDWGEKKQTIDKRVLRPGRVYQVPLEEPRQ
jgi:hypothetical protein